MKSHRNTCSHHFMRLHIFCAKVSEREKKCKIRIRKINISIIFIWAIKLGMIYILNSARDCCCASPHGSTWMPSSFIVFSLSLFFSLRFFSHLIHSVLLVVSSTYFSICSFFVCYSRLLSTCLCDAGCCSPLCLKNESSKNAICTWHNDDEE